MSASNYFLAFATLVSIAGAWFDWRSGKQAEVGEGREGEIPNALTLGALAIAPIVWLAWGWHVAGPRAGLEAAGFSCLGAFTCALIPLFMWQGGAMGAGDVKLLAAIGAILRPLVGIEAEFYAFAAAAIIVPAQLAWHGKLFKTLGNSLALAINPLLPKNKRREIPKESMTWARFGPAIALGTLIAALFHWKAGNAK